MCTYIHPTLYFLAPTSIDPTRNRGKVLNAMNAGKNILDTLQREYLELAKEHFVKNILDKASFEAEISKIKMTAYDLLSGISESREDAFDQIIDTEKKCQELMEEQYGLELVTHTKEYHSKRTWVSGDSAVYPLFLNRNKQVS